MWVLVVRMRRRGPGAEAVPASAPSSGDQARACRVGILLAVERDHVAAVTV